MRALSWRTPWLWIVLACTALLYGQSAQVGFIGQDTYPILASCRVASAGDFAALFGERLMGGTHNLYRPVFNLTVALDQLAFGLWSPGHQLTSALFFAACALASGLLAGRLLGPGSRAAAPVAALAFLLFPAHYEVLPVIARRPDTMVYAFTCLALWSQLSERALAAQRPPWTPAVLALLAMGSKDSGVLVEPLCFLAVLLYSPRATLRARVAHALRAMIPHAVVAALFLVARSAVVEGLGGMQARDTWAYLLTWPEQVGTMLAALVWPERVLAPAALTGPLSAALALALVAASVVGRGASEATSRALRAALIACVWLLMLTLMYATREVWREWYVFQLVAPWVLLWAAAAEHLLGLVRARIPLARGAAVVALALLAATLLWNARTSPLVHSYTEWSDQTADVNGFYAELDRRIRAAALPALVEAPPMPVVKAQPPSDRPFVQVTRNVRPNAIRAWLELHHPGVRMRTAHPTQARLRPKDELVLVSAAFPRRERGE